MLVERAASMVDMAPVVGRRPVAEQTAPEADRDMLARRLPAGMGSTPGTVDIQAVVGVDRVCLGRVRQERQARAVCRDTGPAPSSPSAHPLPQKGLGRRGAQ